MVMKKKITKKCKMGCFGEDRVFFILCVFCDFGVSILMDGDCIYNGDWVIFKRSHAYT